LLDRIPGDQMASHGRRRPKFGQERPVVRCILTAIPVRGI
jgi:hypothetical protein